MLFIAAGRARRKDALGLTLNGQSRLAEQTAHYRIVKSLGAADGGALN